MMVGVYIDAATLYFFFPFINLFFIATRELPTILDNKKHRVFSEVKASGRRA